MWNHNYSTKHKSSSKCKLDHFRRHWSVGTHKDSSWKWIGCLTSELSVKRNYATLEEKNGSYKYKNSIGERIPKLVILVKGFTTFSASDSKFDKPFVCVCEAQLRQTITGKEIVSEYYGIVGGLCEAHVKSH